VGPAEQPEDSSDVNDGASGQESQSFAAGEYQYQQQPPATADVDEVDPCSYQQHAGSTHECH
jgi:hypothetical protein